MGIYPWAALRGLLERGLTSFCLGFREGGGDSHPLVDRLDSIFHWLACL